jgi:hypothetical protein
MTQLSELPVISECSVAGCSYNDHSNCKAPAITVGASNCVTFIPLSVKGGLDKVVSHVGACQRAECTHNSHLECTAASIRVGADATSMADCLTFAPR